MRKNKLELLTLGSDPELFLQNLAGEVESSIPYVSGTKADPQHLEKGFYIQKDNILVEYNIPPSPSKKDFTENMQIGMQLVRNFLPPHILIDIASSHTITEYMANSHEDVKIFGCEPDIIAWDPEEPHMLNIDVETNFLRTAGGHVHIGYKDPTSASNLEIIKSLDLFLGIGSVIMDDDKVRRSMYGAAGSFRHKQYGVEYRTLSNFWLSDVRTMDWIWDNIEQAFKFINDGNVIDETSDAQMIQDCINDSDRELALHFINKFNINIPSYVAKEQKIQSKISKSTHL